MKKKVKDIWISMEDEIPPVGVKVLLWYKGYGCEIASKSDANEWWDNNDNYMDDDPEFTHWMRLPNGPK